MSIEIGDYVEVRSENPYDTTIAALIKANATALEEDKAKGGDGTTLVQKAVTITVPVEDEKKTKFKVSRAANDAGFTARLRSSNVSEDTTAVSLVYTLTDRHAPRRHKGDTEKNSKPVEAKDADVVTEIGSPRNDDSEAEAYIVADA